LLLLILVLFIISCSLASTLLSSIKILPRSPLFITFNLVIFHVSHPYINSTDLFWLFLLFAYIFLMIKFSKNHATEADPHEGQPSVRNEAISKSEYIKQHLDSKVSWFVCVCSSLANVIIMGCLYTYGILFPRILDEFQAGKARTGEYSKLITVDRILKCPWLTTFYLILIRQLWLRQ